LRSAKSHDPNLAEGGSGRFIQITAVGTYFRSVTDGERIAPVFCLVGLLAEFLFGFPLYFAVNAVWSSFYYAPIDAGKWTWLGTQGASIAIYVIGVMFAYGGINRTSRILPSSRTL
jgi:hypothetical protein